tara:strand:- start:1049 stop:1276 length:228 start_codon:yes stop_codon:yes gene_type:complete
MNYNLRLAKKHTAFRVRAIKTKEENWKSQWNAAYAKWARKGLMDPSYSHMPASVIDPNSDLSQIKDQYEYMFGKE